MFHVEIITPEETVYSGNAVSLTVPTPDGEIGILQGHVPLVAIVVSGSILLRAGRAEEELFAVSRGLVEIDGKSVRVLVETADRAEALEEETIRLAKERAEKLMAERRDDTEGFAEAQAVLERELNRLHVARRYRSRRSRVPS
jgi:F-type H+-transporting ATPase subunit epsilon